MSVLVYLEVLDPVAVEVLVLVARDPGGWCDLSELLPVSRELLVVRCSVLVEGAALVGSASWP